MRPLTDRLEIARREAIAKRGRAIWIALGIAGIGWVVALLIMAAGAETAVPGILAGGFFSIVALLVHLLVGGGAKKAYLAAFKKGVFTEAASIAVPGISYLPESMLPEHTFENGGLFGSRIDRYNGEDCFTGRCGATDLIFSQLHVERKETTTDSEGRNSTKWVTVFKGIYLVADFHKDFSCRVKIVPDVAEANFGWIGRKLQGVSGDLVRLENPQFESAFKVTATDQQAARYLLTPDMQERFLALRGQWNSAIRAAFLDSFLHLAIPMKENWFEPNMSVPAGDVAVLETFLSQLMIVLHITETLDLNTRIWTKQ
ncbi:DUF3137 domain-containing protein [Akkermansiaceae bacterium]|nr:DUF3137 domain-containing protein [Akkermansiaceae bacterium]